MNAERIRLRGRVQGVGFRPTVARLAAEHHLPGWVRNDVEGVELALGGDRAARDRFLAALVDGLPPLASIDEVVRTGDVELSGDGFAILDSALATAAGTSAIVVPDAAVCAACAAEVLDPLARRYRYPFTNCTHCGPRFTIATSIPWDRARTTMAGFPLCPACRGEYVDVTDRRYHAEPIACFACGPKVELARADRRAFTVDAMSMLDAVDAVATLLHRGEIVALKGVGGFQLLCDATSADAVARLRTRKHRPSKPFALMARDVAVVEAWCELSARERQVLTSPAAPIVLLRARADATPAIADGVSPTPTGGVVRHGVMLPSTPLHLLALRRCTRPLVCTSGNRSEEPQVIDDAEAFDRLADIADWIVGHDRPIHNRVDDSVVQVVDERPRVLRRARGYAPAPLPLPPGFAEVARRVAVAAAGADLKASVCLSRAGDLVLSQHLGDLDDARASAAYVEQWHRLSALFDHRPTLVVTDNHPESRAAAHALAVAEAHGAPLTTVAHHHAHFAACLGEHRVPRTAPPMLGLVLDGIGLGDDDRSLWGGEVFVGGYARAERVATLKPVALLGGDRAAREPWRCLYAHLRAEQSWGELRSSFGDVAVVQRLQTKPVAVLDQMLRTGTGAPRASSCGRLFDAVAAALDLCFEGQSHEAEAAMALEALVTPDALAQVLAERAEDEIYPLPTPLVRAGEPGAGLPYLEPLGLWRAILGDLATGVAPSIIAARFHVALAAGLARLVDKVARTRAAAGQPVERVVALSGGCLQNTVLHRRLVAELEAAGFKTMAHGEVPASDGGVALGQALVALARAAEQERPACA